MQRIVITIGMVLLVVVLVFSPFTAWATSYDYIVDQEGLFDDSSEMVALAREIRGQLDFNLHIYTIPTLSNLYTQSIIETYRQDASALLIFVSTDGNLSWWSGTAVKKVIRDVELEMIFEQATVSNQQYTTPVNLVLQAILDKFMDKQEVIPPQNDSSEKEEDYVLRRFHLILQYIRSHPATILAIIIALGVFAYWSNHQYQELKDKK